LWSCSNNITACLIISVASNDVVDY
jgi:hypothetical protein